jgi:hypothetical protein
LEIWGCPKLGRPLACVPGARANKLLVSIPNSSDFTRNLGVLQAPKPRSFYARTRCLITELVSALPIRDNPTFVRYLQTEEMIDPVTALHVLDKAASLAGALSQVFKAVYDYARSVKDAPEHSRQLQDELYNLSNIARRLEITLAKESIPRVKSNVAEDSIVRFVEILKEMERKVAIPEGKMSIKRLRWPFTLKENMEYLEKIERFKATLILASNVHQRYHSLLRQ